ncbi:DUF969 domain-containing protein [Burkholderia sp. WAC0059]|nr:DUF969 domain-containing protein [Burkholderia sp. WAC0059]
MHATVSLWPLLGIAVIAAGFFLRFNPMLVIVSSAIVTALCAHMSVDRILAALGDGFMETRNLPLIILMPLAVIGLLERHGLREHAQEWIARIRLATTGRLLVAYLVVRQITSAFGLSSLGGVPQMVRPLVAPMAEGAALARYGRLPEALRLHIRALCASADTIGLFYGEDLFVAFGGILLMQTFLRSVGIEETPLRIALAGLPTAACALVVHGIRLYRVDATLSRQLGAATAGGDGRDGREETDEGDRSGAGGAGSKSGTSGKGSISGERRPYEANGGLDLDTPARAGGAVSGKGDDALAAGD